MVKRTNTHIIRILQPDSEVLENVTQGFHTILRSREQAQIYHIASDRAPASQVDPRYGVPRKAIA